MTESAVSLDPSWKMILPNLLHEQVKWVRLLCLTDKKYVQTKKERT